MYKDNAPDFQTRTGFFQRPDIRWFSNFAQRRFYVEGKHLLWHGPSIYTRNIWDHNGLRIEYFTNANYKWFFSNRNNIGVYANYGRERLRPADYSQLSNNIDIPHDQVGFFFNSQYFNWMTLNWRRTSGAIPITIRCSAVRRWAIVRSPPFLRSGQVALRAGLGHLPSQ